MPISKRNRRGVLWLLLLGFVIAYSPRVLSLLSERTPMSFTEEEMLDMHTKFTEEKKEKEIAASTSSSKYKAAPERFDPNNYALEDWMNLGLSEKQADVILKFTERGINSNEELQKIFVLPEEVYLLIKDSTFYPVRTNDYSYRKNETRTAILVDINTANEEELIQIPGIGPFYAEKIKEYREELGGYVGIEQLLEIWKFDEERLESVRQYMKFNPSNVRKLSLSNATVDALKAHPYISYKVANSIVKMRMHETYETIEDVKRSKLIDEELFKKIEPYIEL